MPCEGRLREVKRSDEWAQGEARGEACFGDGEERMVKAKKDVEQEEKFGRP